MPQYYHKFAAHIGTGQSDSTAVNTQGFGRMTVQLPAATNMEYSTVTPSLKGSDTEDGTYYTLRTRSGTTDSTCIGAYGALGYSVAIGPECMSFPQYVKLCFDTTATAAAGYTGYFVCGRDV